MAIKCTFILVVGSTPQHILLLLCYCPSSPFILI